MKSDIHVIPQFEGERVHDESEACWCGPGWVNKAESDEYGDARVWVHNRPQ